MMYTRWENTIVWGGEFQVEWIVWGPYSVCDTPGPFVYVHGKRDLAFNSNYLVGTFAAAPRLMLTSKVVMASTATRHPLVW
jgi:hypothetical protein